MGYGAQQVVQHYVENGDAARRLIHKWEGLAQTAQDGLAQVRAEEMSARRALAVAYLVELTPAAIARSEKLIGFRGFTRRDPLKAMAHEKAVLQKTIARIVSDERWQRRKYLVGAQGELTRERAEAASLLEPWEHECKKFEDHDRFLRLYESKYDTPDWDEQWYEGAYWKDWAAGDRICAAMGYDDFGDDLLPVYQAARTSREQWRGEVAKVDAKIDAVHKLVRNRDSAEQRIPRLPELYLDQCRDQLAQFFVNADFGLLEEWLEAAGGDRGVQQVLRRCAGLKAKLDFLKELVNQGIKDQIDGLNERLRKFNRKASKYERSKYQGMRFGDEVLDPKFRLKLDKYNAQPEKLDRQIQRMVSYDDYGRFDLNNDPELWWVTFTKKGPSRFTPRLRNWYERHPNAAPQFDADDVGEAVGKAAATFEKHDSGYLS